MYRKYTVHRTKNGCSVPVASTQFFLEGGEWGGEISPGGKPTWTLSHFALVFLFGGGAISPYPSPRIDATVYV